MVRTTCCSSADRMATAEGRRRRDPPFWFSGFLKTRHDHARSGPGVKGSHAVASAPHPPLMKPPEAHTGWAWGFAFRGRRVATPAPLPCASKKSSETRDALDRSGPGVRPAPRAGRGPSLPSADGGASDPSETPTVLSHREIRRVGVEGYTRSRMPQNLRPSVRERLGSFQKIQ
jgi:hypothetical protein